MQSDSRPSLRYRLRLLLCALMLAARGEVLADEPQMTLHDLVALHTSTLSLIRVVDARFESSFYRHGNRRSDPDKRAEWRWTFDVVNDKERIRQSSEDQTRFLDIFKDGDEQRLLTGWNPRRPPHLTLDDQRGVWAAIGPRWEQNLHNAYPSRYLLMTFKDSGPDSVGAPKRPLPLRSYLKSIDRIEGPDRVEDDGRPLWRLKLFRRNEGHHYRELLFDPEVGYWVRKSVQYEPSQGDLLSSETVTKFKRLGSGVFFPEEMVITSGRDSRMWSKRVTQLTINADLPKDAFDFRFPENALVCHLPAHLLSQPTQLPVSVWGPDNRPLGSRQEVLAQQLRKGPGYSRIALTVFAVLVLGALCGTALWRLWIRKSIG